MTCIQAVDAIRKHVNRSDFIAAIQQAKATYPDGYLTNICQTNDYSFGLCVRVCDENGLDWPVLLFRGLSYIEARAFEITWRNI
jgi:hypothetical protein